MPRKPRLFFDSSPLIAAAGSPEGGSSLLLELCVKGKAGALVTQLVLREAERNIQAKMDKKALLRFYEVLGALGPKPVPLPSAEALARAAEVVASKEAHVVGGAQEVQATHLITLDRKHLLREDVQQALLPIVVCTPGDYLQKLLEEKGA